MIRRVVSKIWLLLALAAGSLPAFAQSQNQNVPTPVRTNEIVGAIKARDIGDPRLTSYFYTFNGTQGDIFINVVTKNFNGDIDIFAVEGLKSLTKIVVYADSPDTETGRLIYLRKPEKLLLRVEGRSPNDDPATFRIKFAGSFEAIKGGAGTDGPEMPEIKVESDSGVRVNSVGTIIEVIPKLKPTPKQTAARTEERKEEAKEPEKPSDDTEAKAADGDKSRNENKAKVLVSENIRPPRKVETAPKRVVKPPAGKPVKPATARKTEEKKETAAKTPTVKPGAKPKTLEPREPEAPNPLDSIRLVILFKDGKKIERPMSEVIRFNVDKGVLTVVLKDGTLSRHSLLDVEKVTIE